ncbi:hypothetical protein R3W88_023988 [Solanum pinnatisectum]|uniref:Uncharacterized protein n=1 Tax=Solanum pinnatisectum TaxID=50273 RepID=A0AAV9M2B5_9SOLN|nr:hypothetical protein R3W88_023988 [Solanum pinnatisectum]
MNSRSTRSLSKKRVERVFYHGATITCSLGLDKSTRICNKKTCGVCKIIVQNCRLIHEETKWIESFSTSCWSAHRKIMKQFGDGISKKAIIVSRVIAKCKEDNKGEFVLIYRPKVCHVNFYLCCSDYSKISIDVFEILQN